MLTRISHLLKIKPCFEYTKENIDIKIKYILQFCWKRLQQNEW